MNVIIERISLCEDGTLLIKSNDYSFDKIYRAAMGVNWNVKEQSLFNTQNGTWGVLDCYKQILLAVKVEYAVNLTLSPKTIFENIDSNVISSIRELNIDPK